MELIQLPLPFIRNLPRAVIEFSIPVHSVLEPFTVIETTLLVEELPVTVSPMICHVPLIFGTSLVLLDYVCEGGIVAGIVDRLGVCAADLK